MRPVLHASATVVTEYSLKSVHLHPVSEGDRLRTVYAPSSCLQMKSVSIHFQSVYYKRIRPTSQTEQSGLLLRGRNGGIIETTLPGVHQQL